MIEIDFHEQANLLPSHDLTMEFITFCDKHPEGSQAYCVATGGEIRGPFYVVGCPRLMSSDDYEIMMLYTGLGENPDKADFLISTDSVFVYDEVEDEEEDDSHPDYIETEHHAIFGNEFD